MVTLALHGQKVAVSLEGCELSKGELSQDISDVPKFVSTTEVTGRQPSSAVGGDSSLRRWKRQAWGESVPRITYGT